MTKQLGLVMVMLACLGSVALGQAAGKPEAATLLKQASAQIAGTDEAARKEGVRTVVGLLESEPAVAVGSLRGFVATLMSAKAYDAVEELAVRGILAMPQDTAGVEALQLARVRALQAAGQPDAALAQARGLFNICSMATTKDVLLLVTECLNAANPGDLKVAERFKAQQIAGAAPPGASTHSSTATTRRAGAPALGEPILLGIKLEGKEFEEAARKIFAEDFASLTGKGNLLLLANKPAEARPIFERAYAVAPDASLTPATENLARCMKAEDGTIGRASAWVLSLRPAPVAPVVPAKKAGRVN